MNGQKPRKHNNNSKKNIYIFNCTLKPMKAIRVSRLLIVQITLCLFSSLP